MLCFLAIRPSVTTCPPRTSHLLPHTFQMPPKKFATLIMIFLVFVLWQFGHLVSNPNLVSPIMLFFWFLQFGRPLTIWQVYKSPFFWDAMPFDIWQAICHLNFDRNSNCVNYELFACKLNLWANWFLVGVLINWSHVTTWQMVIDHWWSNSLFFWGRIKLLSSNNSLPSKYDWLQMIWMTQNH